MNVGLLWALGTLGTNVPRPCSPGAPSGPVGERDLWVGTVAAAGGVLVHSGMGWARGTSPRSGGGEVGGVWRLLP